MCVNYTQIKEEEEIRATLFVDGQMDKIPKDKNEYIERASDTENHMNMSTV